MSDMVNGLKTDVTGAASTTIEIGATWARLKEKPERKEKEVL
ncbi:MAG TPA: hypothetical protein VMH36_26565 [Alphaproteobacteria bacterium]|nr:hypothetical protein [Alphaproteobacteria bacterium]